MRLTRILCFSRNSWLCYGFLLVGLFFLVGGLLPPLGVKCGQPIMADWLYEVFSASCQQQPTRTFWILGYPMALCARCIGVYLGFSSGALYCSIQQQRVTLSGFVIVVLVTVAFGEKLLEWSNLWLANNTVRLLSGIGLGFLIFLLVSWVMSSVMMRVKGYAIALFSKTKPLSRLD